MKAYDFNLNMSAEVILTQAGANIANKYFKDLSQYDCSHQMAYKTYKEGDVFSTMLWEIMQIFGQYIHTGCDIPFKNNNIKISNE